MREYIIWLLSTCVSAYSFEFAHMRFASRQFDVCEMQGKNAVVGTAACQTQAIGDIVEEVSSSKKPRTRDISGVLVEDPTGSRMLLRPEDVSSYTMLSTCSLQQVVYAGASGCGQIALRAVSA